MRFYGISGFFWLLTASICLGQAKPEIDANNFLQNHCHHCHGPEDPAAEFRTDLLQENFEDRQVRQQWSEVVNVLNSHQMPPEEEPQPDPQQVAQLVDWITGQLADSERSQVDQQVVLRRLNRLEYQNTMRDLLGVDVDIAKFPQDASAGGFDNNGSALTLSPLLMELYYQAAQQALDQCLVEGQRPPVLKWRIEPESGDSDSNRVTYDGQRLIVNGGQNRVEGDYKVMHHDSWDRHLNFRDFAVPYPGKYRLRIRAAARIPTRDQVIASAEPFYRQRMESDIEKRPDAERHFRAAYQENLEHLRTDPMYDYGPPRLKLVKNLGGQPSVVDEFDVDAPLSEPQEYVLETWFSDQRAGVTVEYAYSIPKELENFWYQTSDEFARPELWVDWIELEGPLNPQWPPESHRRLLMTDQVKLEFKDATAAAEHAAAVIKRLMQYAYRRPVAEEEWRQQLPLFEQAYANSQDFEQAIRAPLIAVLISPDFLYLKQPRVEGKLSSMELATRLSYFLWSTMPDDILLRSAAQGKLNQPEELERQVMRMLDDPRCAALSQNFAGQWLGLRDVGANPPAMDLYPRYDRHLEESLVQESIAFFQHILEEDLELRNFIRSDFVVINERLGRYYGIPGVKGDHFRSVPVPDTVHRGGLVTQASMLTITSNGTRTSPVKRGTWILKNLLGMDPGLPVANAGDIAPKVPGIDKATVRQRLEIHRQLPQCARCHNRIDPLGFALENYNAAGAWRDREGFGYKGRIGDNDPVIDASAQMIDGRKFQGVQGLQEALLDQEDLFLKCLTRKMLSYALGREVGWSDEPQVQACVESLKSEGATLRNLIRWIVRSELFQRP